jgi:hypothetical protein
MLEIYSYQMQKREKFLTDWAERIAELAPLNLE